MQTVEAPRIYPTFRYNDAATMIDWLGRAFGFEVRAKYMNGEHVAHAELAFGSSMIMLGSVRDDDYGAVVGGPGQAGGKSVYIAVDDLDAHCERARAAGAKIIEQATDRDYGSREYSCADPEGNIWGFGSYWPKAHQPTE